ncbi:RNA polymerase sigma-I factor [Ornithinibacillus halophilus]|uniref:RNA polymerase sigma factor SigI n=1 Tax=Ornithinibacillus halophilus TaxID=930117 RepID=A0A1M5LI82_9BACI|nr:RNA polymerase sigma-I factor [Ornithinibacillus halophilus]SHG64073.1 RNA polymerase sigma factor [Ornithinibacillus halophilus]
MREIDIEKYVSKAAHGDELYREKLIRHYKPYIISVVGKVCKRYISWSDDESSIGLLAFNRAINTYDCNAEASFPTYVYLLIKRDLIDYFRRENKKRNIPLEITVNTEEDLLNLYDAEKAMDTYQEEVTKSDLIEEILELSQALEDYKVKFEELEKYSPKHRDTREWIHTLADDFLNYPELVSRFKEKKKLPVTAFIKKTAYKRKNIERYRKYIVTIILMKLNPEWENLSEYIQLTPLEGGEK